MRFAKANGLVIHHLIEGPEALPPLVFINPLGCDLRVWSEVASILKPDFRVVCYDKRGHGLSESGPDRCEMADCGRDLAALLDVLGIVRASIVGMSIGGMIAQELYRQRPDLVAALVLCGTARRSEPTNPGTSVSPRSGAAGLSRSPARSSSAGSPPIFAAGALPNSPAFAPC
jgi:3-oxoadipate enol-lactonase